jgi:hypothetical protein
MGAGNDRDRGGGGGAQHYRPCERERLQGQQHGELCGHVLGRTGDRHTAQWTFDNLATTGTVASRPDQVRYRERDIHVHGGGSLQGDAEPDRPSGAGRVNTAGDVEAIVVVDPSAGCTIGGGWFTSPAGRTVRSEGERQGELRFTTKAKNATNPKGETQFSSSWRGWNSTR